VPGSDATGQFSCIVALILRRFLAKIFMNNYLRVITSSYHILFGGGHLSEVENGSNAKVRHRKLPILALKSVTAC
jgi:hypothetical protein